MTMRHAPNDDDDLDDELDLNDNRSDDGEAEEDPFISPADSSAVPVARSRASKPSPSSCSWRAVARALRCLCVTCLAVVGLAAALYGTFRVRRAQEIDRVVGGHLREESCREDRILLDDVLEDAHRERCDHVRKRVGRLAELHALEHVRSFGAVECLERVGRVGRRLGADRRDQCRRIGRPAEQFGHSPVLGRRVCRILDHGPSTTTGS